MRITAMRILTGFLLSFLICSCAERQQLASITLNNKGVEQLKADNTTAAQQSFVEALAASPFEPAYHNNLGVALDGAKEIDKALKSYTVAEERATQGPVQFTSRFNLAQAYAKQGKLPEALAWYQKALDVNPTSIEAKTNIELLTKQQNGGGGGGQGQNQKDSKDKKDGQGEGDKDQKDKPKDAPYAKNQKYQPRPFKGDLSENDVKKILGEIKQQEQKIRADYNRKESKEQPREKDW
jgi:Ca-activated chloride channel family protein